MRELLQAVADVVTPLLGDDIEIEFFDPMWRDPGKGVVLSVYPRTLVPGTFNTSGSQEGLIEINVEYTEPSGAQASTLERDEEAELDTYDLAVATWAEVCKFVPAGDNGYDKTPPTVEFTPQTPRQLLVRYFRVRFQVRMVTEWTP